MCAKGSGWVCSKGRSYGSFHLKKGGFYHLRDLQQSSSAGES